MCISEENVFENLFEAGFAYLSKTNFAKRKNYVRTYIYDEVINKTLNGDIFP